jgi:hypothetical protein
VAVGVQVGVMVWVGVLVGVEHIVRVVLPITVVPLQI